MYSIIYGSLSRQHKALQLLHDLLEEEYRSIMGRKLDAVCSLEFSIQELIRQLAVEKTMVMKGLNGVRAREYAAMLPEEQASALLQILLDIDAGEQQVARQASRNSTLSLALLDQSSRNLNAFTQQVMPFHAQTYGRRGGMRVRQHPQAAIISGRL
ncbi:MAG: flagellar export chaperone FlgN [Desulfovibrio sp.]|nr:flagellar export chaperone FlgN [Desulfovibrio sp.]